MSNSKAKRPPDLHHAVSVLENIARDTHLKTPKAIGEIYLASLALLYHLRLDQATIRTIRKQNANAESIAFPKPNSIPAMMAVIHNQRLFRALVACLSCSADDTTNSTNKPTFPVLQSRKRTHSVSGDTPSDNTLGTPAHKFAKTSHSPHPPKRVIRAPMANGALNPNLTKPEFNVRVLAATILFISFEHLDHWPVPLVQAYADDCFGARLWVDLPTCGLLAKNLAFTHCSKGKASDDSPSENSLEKAKLISDFYKGSVLESKPEDLGEKVLSSPSKQVRRGSHSSVSSHLSSMSQRSAGISQRNRALSYDSAAGKASLNPTPSANADKESKNDSDSDSGDDEEIAVTTNLGKASGTAANDDDASSSSGEEDEEEEVVLASTRSFDEDLNSSPKAVDPHALKLTYPVVQARIRFERIRQRYFGTNLDSAHSAIAHSLNDRLDLKSKQNSGLLQCLPSFTSIPPVRSLVAGNLEKWLQSPALAGLARNLFSTTVKSMKNAEPPLADDLEVISCILSMRLKSNQLNAHVENVTSIAKLMPTRTAADHIFSNLLIQILRAMDTSESYSNLLKMIHAVYTTLPRKLSSDAIAFSLHKVLFEKTDSTASTAPLVNKVRGLIKAIGKELGPTFDGLNLLSSLVFQQIPSESITMEGLGNKARVLFQCATLLPKHHELAKKSTSANGDEEELANSLAHIISTARRLLLKWCCREFAPHIKEPKAKIEGEKTKKEEIVGAGPADYTSILDGINTTKFPKWLDVARCILFLEDSSSDRMKRVLALSASEWEEELKKIDLCSKYGASVDDEIVWTVIKSASLKSGGIPKPMALALLEHLFNSCRQGGNASLDVRDPNIVWELYQLVEYKPPKGRHGQVSKKEKGDKEEDTGAMDVDENMKTGKGEENSTEDAKDITAAETPKLAYPGMWWRVTGLALILCGKSPSEIGSVAWEDHPTLRALIKMVTSDRFRFPTVDCDAIAREDMLKSEQSMRSEEGKITESLFNPRKKVSKKRKKDVALEGPRGSRMSRRQKDKREKQLKKQREKEAAQEKAEQIKRKKMMRAAQKSIMLWDPRNGARKPPKESVELIFSVNDLFDLAGAFQKNVEPDFLLLTIGNTSRGAIERAYDWLIPIISQIPDAIQRLPASASCFLLLRAYGTEGEERDQLQKLSAPLLVHVRDSLTGKFGEADAKRAFDLLLADAANHNAERRRNARRVLNDALGEEREISVEATSAFHSTKFSWMVKMTSVEHATSFIGEAISYLYRAASFERGRTLRFHVLALELLTEFAKRKQIPGDWDFAAMLVKLISTRPTVLAASMSSYPDLRSMAIRVVHDEFDAHVRSPPVSDEDKNDSYVEIKLHCGPTETDEASIGVVDAVLPRTLLESSCVLLSIWLDDQKETEENGAVRELVKMLMEPREGSSESSSPVDTLDGLASARAASSGKSVVPVESWVMLAKSRSDFIAKRAALTAPIGFLTRLLLCSGLPRASLLTMIDRLGKVGDEAESKDKAFNQLLASSATSEWDIGRLGPRREVSRKLLGRLSAYSRMYDLDKARTEESITLAFLNWLSDTCKSNEKSRKLKAKKAKPVPSKGLGSLDKLGAVFESLCSVDGGCAGDSEVQIKGDASDMAKFLAFRNEEILSKGGSLTEKDILTSIKGAFESNELNKLNSLLELHFEHHSPPKKTRKRKRDSIENPIAKADEACFLLLQSFCTIERKTESLACCILKWVPKLSVSSGSPKLWQLLFQADPKPYSMWKNLVSRCCECWSGRHVAECRDWILAQKELDCLDLDNSVRFFLLSSSLHSVDISRPGTTQAKRGDTSWGRTEDTVLAVTRLALDCLVKSEDELMESRLRSRNELPEGMIVLLLLARLGKKQVNCISQAIVERMKDADEGALFRFHAIILRVYAYFPQSMNLGVAVLRTVLKSSVDSLAVDWLSWRSPMDDEYQDMLETAVAHAAPSRIVQALAEAAKKHPLLLLRKTRYLKQVLSMDAVAIDNHGMNGKSGVIVGQNASGPLVAKMEGRLVKLSVKHWGFNYTENIWTALLDIVSNAPAEVLYGCGLKMGMKDFLEVYLRLMFIQTQLRTSDRFPRLKKKYGDMLKAFEKSNPEAWETWLSSEISDLDSLGVVRNVLMSCNFISHQEAIDYVKKINAK